MKTGTDRQQFSVPVFKEKIDHRLIFIRIVSACGVQHFTVLLQQVISSDDYSFLKHHQSPIEACFPVPFPETPFPSVSDSAFAGTRHVGKDIIIVLF